jgi:hypothetical protein
MPTPSAERATPAALFDLLTAAADCRTTLAALDAAITDHLAAHPDGLGTDAAARIRNTQANWERIRRTPVQELLGAVERIAHGESPAVVVHTAALAILATARAPDREDVIR